MLGLLYVLINVALLYLDFTLNDLRTGAGIEVKAACLSVTKSLGRSVSLTSPCFEALILQSLEQVVVKFG